MSTSPPATSPSCLQNRGMTMLRTFCVKVNGPRYEFLFSWQLSNSNKNDASTICQKLGRIGLKKKKEQVK